MCRDFLGGEQGGEGSLDPRWSSPRLQTPSPLPLSQGGLSGQVCHIPDSKMVGTFLLHQHHPLLMTQRLASSTATLGAGLALQPLAPRPPRRDLPLRGQEADHLTRVTKGMIVPETLVVLPSNLTPITMRPKPFKKNTFPTHPVFSLQTEEV